jgi:cell division initiation protein
MKFNSVEINERTFRKKLFGLDPEQIFDFLRKLSIEMDLLTKEKAELKKTCKKLETDLDEYRQRDELLKNTLANATKMSDRIRLDSDRECKLIINDAHQKADMIVREAKDSLKNIYHEVADLKRVRMQFENNIRALIQSHIAMLEQSRQIMPDPTIDAEKLKATLNTTNFQGSPALSVQTQRLVNDYVNPANARLDV